MLQYLIKMSISLAVLFIFYRAVLRPLTFYQWNRFYLLGYSLLSFIIPFIDISSWMQDHKTKDLVNIIPAINIYSIGATSEPAKEISWIQRLTSTDWLLLVFCLGAGVMLVKLLLQYRSLRIIRNKAILLDGNADMQLFETAAVVSPFSFGNAIYFNRQLHTEEELQRIIQHEFVHVKQKHTIDLLMGELLCVINWFNPFAWLIRYSIRQNLEFVADNKVVSNGVNKKEYQYLLLKVIGAPQYSIANNFNFSNLKKRIAMMNKMKSAKLHLTKFLFVLPLLAVLLLAFRNKIEEQKNETDKNVNIAGMVIDVVSMEPVANATVYCKEKNVTAVTDDKGYYILQLPYENKPLQFTLQVAKNGYSSFTAIENWGNFYHDHVRKLYSNSIELFGLGKGLKNGNGFSLLAGSAPDKQGIDYAAVLIKLKSLKKGMNGNKVIWNDTVPAVGPVKVTDAPPPPPLAPLPVTEPNNKGFIVTIADNSGECIVLVKNKQQVITKAMTLVEWNKNKEANESQYGMIPPPPPPLVKLDFAPADRTLAPVKIDLDFAPANPQPLIVNDNLPADVEGIVTASNIDKKKGTKTSTATVTLKNGKKEFYNLNNPGDKAKFKEKYGNGGEIRFQPALPLHVAPPVKIVDTLKKPLVIIDGVVQVQDFAVNAISADKIESMTVLKAQPAIAAYGDKAVNGAVLVTLKKNGDINKVQIRTKQDTGYFPKDVLVIIDDKEIPYGSKIADYVQAANIESMTVLKDKMATDKYGDKGKSGVIEVISKSKTQGNKKAILQQPSAFFHSSAIDKMQADSIVTMRTGSETDFIELTFDLRTNSIRYTPANALVLLDGKPLPEYARIYDYIARNDIREIKASKDKSDTNKYGSQAKNGVITIQSKEKEKRKI